MKIKTKVLPHCDGDYMSVEIVDCEGFGIQENVDASDASEYAHTLTQALIDVFNYLNMSEDEMKQHFKAYNLT